MSRSYLLVIGDAAPLAWVLAEQRMAFPKLRRSQAAALEIDDELFIYTTRGCFHNPTRDRGRVMGLALVRSVVRDLAEPVVFGERRYTSGCTVDIQGVAPLHEGVELRPLVPHLHAFPNARTWSIRLRRPLVARAGAHAAALTTRQTSRPLTSLDLIQPVQRTCPQQGHRRVPGGALAEEDIRERSRQLTETVISIWPRPILVTAEPATE